MKKENKVFVQQQIYKETVDKVNRLALLTGQSKARIYERSVQRLYNNIEKARANKKKVA